MLFGGAGNDVITGGNGSDTINLSGSTTAITVNLAVGTSTSASEGTDTLWSIENVVGSAYNDTLIGDTNDNTFVGGAGADSITGGGGSDTVDYSASALGVTIDLSLGTGVGGDAGGDVLLGIRNIIGTALADSLTGDANANFFIGGAGADTIFGGDGIDTVSYATSSAAVNLNLFAGTSAGGDAANDYLLYIENLVGSSYDDTLTGSTGANVIYGGAGNDVLSGSAGVDTLYGGVGNDTYVVDNVNDVIVENAGEGTETVSTSVTWTLGANLENLTLTGLIDLRGTGNSTNNLIIGNTSTGIVSGAKGYNLLQGMDGNDTLMGMGGNDTLDGGTGNDSMVGGVGDDTYYVDSANDVVVENTGEGVDTVRSSISYTLNTYVENLTLTGTSAIDGTGTAANNIMIGNDYANLLTALTGNDSLTGGGGNDTLDGGTGNDAMNGGLGDDSYYVDQIGDKITELTSQGTDSVASSISYILTINVENLTLTGTALTGTGNASNNILIGNASANTLMGLTGIDSLYGGDGNDTLDGGTNNDVMSGGLGDDTYKVDTSNDQIVETASAGTDSVISTASYILSDNVENLTLSGSPAVNGTGNVSNNLITGSTGNNNLYGLGGADTLYGGTGNDMLDGGTGNDSLYGGTGNDTFVVDSANDIIVELAAGGVADLVIASVNWTLGAELEKLTLSGTAGISGTGNALANLITGNAGANLLMGMDGNDTLVGGAGNDTLNGGTGVDSMTGGTGDDLYVVDSLTDKVIEISTGGIDTVQSTLSLTLASYVENLTLTGTTALDGTGNTLANIITGNSGANHLYGAAGDDFLYGGAGNDSLDGGSGNNNLAGGAGDDTYVINSLTDLATEATASGTDKVLSAVSWTLGDNFEGLTLTGTLATSGSGNGLNNTIIGNSGSNILSGGLGNDTITGMGGNDNITGGAGADHFVWNLASGNGTDTITDYNAIGGTGAQGDVLEFHGLLTGTFTYLGAGLFTATGSDHAEARVQGSQVQVDLNGDGTADILFNLTGLHDAAQLTTADFLWS